MPYSSVDGRIHTKKLCSKLPLSEVHFLTENDHFVFLSTRFEWRGEVRATCAVYLRLIGSAYWTFY